ncbi:MAG: YceI family protein [Burkholderiaceae bacterium]|jgi:polyisoprenoid-binding protein YceI|nr:YceI family protein [Burkholderiaceae bacterium]
MNIKYFIALALCASAFHAAPVMAQSPAKLVPAQSEVSFVTKQMGVPVDGKFKKFDAQIQLDPKKPEAGSVAFNIDTGSATLGVAESDAEMPKDIWFNVAKFPQAHFKSTAIKGLGNGKFEVAGKLDIKGNARDVLVPVQITQTGGVSTATGSFVIKRLDFKIGEAEWADTTVVANDVTVKFKLSLTGLGPL